MTHLSVVVPVFNESSLVTELLKRISSSIELVTQDYEIIIIDDGSDDETWNEILSEANKEKRIKGIKFSRNFGQHYAITAGLHKASGEWVVVMDGDLQDQPEFIPFLYEEVIKGYDVVFASRQRRPEKKYYLVIQKLFYLILRILSGIKFDSSHANFSIISRKVVTAYRSFPENSRFYVSTIKWLGFKTNSIKVGHGVRFSGTPSYTFKSRIKLATDIIISFSQRPLNFSIYLGSITAIISANLIIYFLFNQQKELINPTNQTGIILIILTLGGIIMILLGILGAYVGRIFQQVKGRPLYIESDKVNVD